MGGVESLEKHNTTKPQQVVEGGDGGGGGGGGGGGVKAVMSEDGKYEEYKNMAKVCSLPAVNRADDYHVNALNRYLWCARVRNAPELWHGKEATKSYCGDWLDKTSWSINYHIRNIEPWDHANPDKSTKCAACGWAYFRARSQLPANAVITKVETIRGQDTATVHATLSHTTNVNIPQNATDVVITQGANNEPLHNEPPSPPVAHVAFSPPRAQIDVTLPLGATVRPTSTTTTSGSASFVYDVTQSYTISLSEKQQ